MFCRGSRELHMGRELGAAGPAIVGFYHFLTPAVTPDYPWVFYTCFTR